MTATTAPVATSDHLRGPTGPLTGTGTLLRFVLRRDRVRLPVWVGAIALGTVSTALTFPDIYGEAADRQLRAALMGNPAAIAVSGPQIGVEDYTYGAMLTNEMLGFVAVAVALMSILLVVRHTRTDEEAGRTELVRASVVGRHAGLTAALVAAVVANLAVGVVTAVGLASLGLESIDWGGSWLTGAAMASVGIVFAAVAGVAVQITEYAWGASGMAGLVLGATFALRAAGDIGDGTLSWLSPIGWAQRTYAYVDDRWWPLLPALVVTAVLATVAVVLSARRDVGAGLRPPRPGPAGGSPRLASPLALAVRLQRANLVGWAAATFAFGLVFGALIGEIEGFASELEAMQQMVGGALTDDLTDAFLGLLVSMMAMTASIYAVLAALRARAEEGAGRAEPLLATAVGRGRWMASHLTVAVVGSTLVLLAGALGTGITAAVALGDGAVVPTLLGAALVHVAPLLLTVAVAAALFGLAPAASALAWVVVVYALVVGLLGGLLGVPSWMVDLSPFGAVPMLPGEAFVAGPVLVLLALAAALFVAGFAGIRRRDLTTTA